MTDPASATTSRMSAIDDAPHEAGTLGGIRRPIGARVVDDAKFQAALRSSQPRRDQFISVLLMFTYAATAIGLIAMAAVVVLAAINLSR